MNVLSATPAGNGKAVVDTGRGFVVYEHDADGVRRVARDAFGPEHPDIDLVALAGVTP